MKESFRFDSPLMMAFSLAGSVIMLNVLWILCSFPVLTLGASTTVYFRMVYNFWEEKSCDTKDFSRFFIKNFEGWHDSMAFADPRSGNCFFVRFAATVSALQEYYRYFLFVALR